MEASKKKVKSKHWIVGLAIAVAAVLLLSVLFALPYAVHFLYENIAVTSNYEEDAGDVLIYWSNVLGGILAIIAPIALAIVSLGQSRRIFDQNERLVRLETYGASPVIKTNLFGIYSVNTTPHDEGSSDSDRIETVYSIEKDLTVDEILQNQSFELLDDSSIEKDLMIIQIQNQSNYPITKVKAYMDVKNSQGEEVKKESVRLMNFAPSEKQNWSITVAHRDLDPVNAYVKITELEFFTYRDISARMTLFYVATEGTYGANYNVELLLNDSFSESDTEGMLH